MASLIYIQAYIQSWPLTAIFGSALAAILLVLSYIDLREYRLPNPLTYSLIAIGLIWSYLRADISAALIGALAAYLSFVLIAWGFKRLRGIDGLGRGDAKLLAAGGAWCGWTALPMIVLFASLLGILAALLAPFKRQTGTQVSSGEAENWIAFGPCLAAAIMAVWAAQQMV